MTQVSTYEVPSFSKTPSLAWLENRASGLHRDHRIYRLPLSPPVAATKQCFKFNYYQEIKKMQLNNIEHGQSY